MWKNSLQRGRPQVIMWRMRIARWIPKATHTHTVRFFKTYYFSTTKTVARTSLNVTLCVEYSTVQYSTVQYSICHVVTLCVQYSTVYVTLLRYAYSTVQYSTVQYSTVQYSICHVVTLCVQYSTVQYSAVQYSTVQYSTCHVVTLCVQYSTVQYISCCYVIRTVQYSTCHVVTLYLHCLSFVSNAHETLGAAAQLIETLRYQPEGRGFDSRKCHSNFSLALSFQPHYDPGTDLASNRNEYQVYFLVG